MHITIRAFLVGALLWGGASPHGARAQVPVAALPLEESLKRAQVGGKYRMLLRQIKVEKDRQEFSAFRDFGYHAATTCAEHTDLPKGYWVYVYPYWYIWRDRVGEPGERRAWGPEQATGRPDTPQAGDHQSAWASSTKDDSDEWLMLEYERPGVARSLHIHETFNPGAVVRVTVFTLDGREVEVWRRERPRLPRTARYVLRPTVSERVLTNRVKIYLASRSVRGWNEIDAVGLRDESGALQWATAAHASSTYGVAEERGDRRTASPVGPKELEVIE
uniref:Pappalysin-1 SD scarf domain-containing protein n=1 Tax=uncultured Armatimonadetes bacterium TaxID=157466 RepID=A0A6J4IMN8_9BACT|nr:hypothetical protein AVDCRST_MAG63-2220 [uncultured Armatimonadetes bacterium]